MGFFSVVAHSSLPPLSLQLLIVRSGSFVRIRGFVHEGWLPGGGGGVDSRHRFFSFFLWLFSGVTLIQKSWKRLCCPSAGWLGSFGALVGFPSAMAFACIFIYMSLGGRERRHYVLLKVAARSCTIGYNCFFGVYIHVAPYSPPPPL